MGGERGRERRGEGKGGGRRGDGRREGRRERMIKEKLIFLYLLCCIIEWHIFLSQVPVCVQIKDWVVSISIRIKLNDYNNNIL